jgi:hypothetical protein
MHALAAERGGKFMSPDFTSVHGRYSWWCGVEGHPVWEALPSNVIWKQAWCPSCSQDKRVKQLQKTLRTYVTGRGGVIVGDLDGLTHNGKRVIIRCPNAHEWTAAYSQLVNGKTWCPICCRQKGKPRPRTPKTTIETLKQVAAARGGECLSIAYEGAHKRYTWRCGVSEHPAWAATAASVMRGTWCPECARVNHAESGASFEAWGADHRLVFLSREEYTSWEGKYKWRCMHCKEEFHARKRHLLIHIRKKISPCPACRRQATRRR